MRNRLLFFSALFITLPAWSAPCGIAPLSDYLAPGFTCEVDAAMFSNFDFFLQNDTSDTVALTPDEIEVSPLSLPGQVGLRVAGAFEALGAINGPGPAEGLRNIEYRFFFDVIKPGSQFISVRSALNNPLRLAPNPLKFGNIFASNQAANDGALSIADDDDPDLTDTDLLNSPRLIVAADELLHLTAGASAIGTTTPVGFVSVSSADYLFGHEVLVPEPMTAWTVLSGALLFNAVRFKRTRRRKSGNMGPKK
jgi:hypothetical protein